MRVVVVGAGIAGLAAAWEIAGRLPEAEVVVLEAAPTVGGKLRVETVAGVAVDVGAEAMLARRPEGVDLVRAVGLADELVAPLTTAARIRAGGANHPLPPRTVMGIPSDVDAVRPTGALSEAALARVVAEPSLDPLPPLVDDISVGALVRSRLGNEVTDRLVEPLLGGVYAGRADELSLQATVPGLAHVLGADGGSLVGAARRLAGAGTYDAAEGPVFASVSGGLGRLPQALASSGRFAVRTSTTVRELTRTGSGFRLVCGPVPAPEVIEADAVVVATPAVKAGMLLRQVAPAAAGELRGIDAASTAIVTLAFRDVTPPEGSGLLVGALEGFGVKGVTLSSQKWPLPTGGLTLLRASLGRVGEAQVLQRDDADLVALVRHELRALLGIDATPVDALVTRWGGGLPQYRVGHVERVRRIRSGVDAVPGLAVCGASYDGVGIPACVASARAAADQVVGALQARRTMDPWREHAN